MCNTRASTPNAILLKPVVKYLTMYGPARHILAVHWNYFWFSQIISSLATFLCRSWQLFESMRILVRVQQMAH